MGHKDRESKVSRWVQYTAGIYIPRGSGPIVSWDKKHVIYPDRRDLSRSHSRSHSSSHSSSHSRDDSRSRSRSHSSSHKHKHQTDHIHDLVSVDVRTDDRASQDTVEISYSRQGGSGYAQPQSQAQPQATAEEATKKVVRFEESPKPALKKTDTSESEATTPASSEAATSNASDSQTDEPASPKKSKSKKDKQKETKKEKEACKSSESEAESASECDHCVRKREKPQAKKKTATKAKKPDSDTEEVTDESAYETADETSDEQPKKAQKSGKSKGKGKQKAKVDSSDGETENEESAKDTDCSEDEDKKAKKKGKKNKEPNKDAQNDKAGKNNKKNAESKGKDPKKESEASEKVTEEDKKTSSKGKDHESKKYPDAYPGPHPRRPNLIYPIKAEVMHVERVTEAPEDPIPNSYYDEENNVLRVYYGPVYGHHSQSLYPKRDQNQRPLPIGMPHPTQNPYYNGFDRRPDTTGLEHVPITQGMPVPPWNAFAPPMGYAGYPGTFPGGPAWGPMDPNHLQHQGQNKGAFSMVNPAATGAPSSKDQDVAGGNNVFPPGAENPYIPKRTISQFSNIGSNRAPSNASPRNSKTSKPDDNGKPGPSSQQGAWGNNNGNGSGKESRNAGESNGWTNQAPQENNNAWGGSNGGQNCSVQSNSGDNQNTNWGNGDNNNGGNGGNRGNGGNGWPSDGPADNQYTNNGNNNNNNNSAWGNAPQDGAPPAREHNNVMPGSWSGPSETIPSWGDPTMAASTGGKVDTQSW